MAPVLIINGASLRHPFAGVGTYTLRLVRGLSNQTRLPFKVLVPDDAGEAFRLVPPGSSVRVTGNPPPGISLLKTLYWMEKIAATARESYPGSIFHSPESFWSWSRPDRVAITLHDAIYRRFPYYQGRFFLRKWMSRLAEAYAADSALVITVSQCSADDLTALAGIPRERVKVIYQWVEPRFNPDFARQEASRVRARYQLPDEYVLYVGGYDYRKNVEFLIHAYAAARGRGLQSPLVLVGRIPDKIARTLCDVRGAIGQSGLKIGTDVFLPGFIDDADMPGLYGSCRYLVYPSLFEGFGFPPVEAMACGKVALVADNSSLVEIMPQRKNRFPTDDPAALAALLLEANRSEQAFLCPPDPRFTEPFAIKRYVDALQQSFPEIGLSG